MGWGELRTEANPRELQAWFETLPEGRWCAIKAKALFLDGFDSTDIF